MKFLDIFTEIDKGDFGLTDAMIYKSIQMGTDFVPIWGGNQNHSTPNRYVEINARTTKNKEVTIFEGEGIVISFDGSSGNMTYKVNERFALNHHAGFFKVKPGALDKVIPEFFALFYQKQLQEESISEGSKTLTTTQIYEMDFDLPDVKTQEKTMIKLKPLLNKRKIIYEILTKINSLQNKVLSHNYSKYQVKNIHINKILDCMSGNSGLTEEYLYSQIRESGERKYRILTGSTDYCSCDFIHKCRSPKDPSKKITTTEGKNVIHVVRNGKAGTNAYYEEGNYTISDHAYLVYLKDNIPFKIDLKWLMYALKPQFLEYSSSSDNGTWNKTKFFKDISIDLPQYDEQEQVVKVFEEIECIVENLKKINEKIDDLFTKQISSI